MGEIQSKRKKRRITFALGEKHEKKKSFIMEYFKDLLPNLIFKICNTPFIAHCSHVENKWVASNNLPGSYWC